MQGHEIHFEVTTAGNARLPSFTRGRLTKELAPYLNELALVVPDIIPAMGGGMGLRATVQLAALLAEPQEPLHSYPSRGIGATEQTAITDRQQRSRRAGDVGGGPQVGPGLTPRLAIARLTALGRYEALTQGMVDELLREFFTTPPQEGPTTIPSAASQVTANNNVRDDVETLIQSTTPSVAALRTQGRSEGLACAAVAGLLNAFWRSSSTNSEAKSFVEMAPGVAAEQLLMWAHRLVPHWPLPHYGMTKVRIYTSLQGEESLSLAPA